MKSYCFLSPKAGICITTEGHHRGGPVHVLAEFGPISSSCVPPLGWHTGGHWNTVRGGQEGPPVRMAPGVHPSTCHLCSTFIPFISVSKLVYLMGISSLMSLNIYSWFLLPQPLSRYPSPPISLRCTAVNLFFQARNWGVTHLSLPPNHQVLGMLLKCICCPPHRPTNDRVIASVTTKASELAALLPLSLHSVQHFGPREISTSTCHIISPPLLTLLVTTSCSWTNPLLPAWPMERRHRLGPRPGWRSHSTVDTTLKWLVRFFPFHC